MTSRQPGAMPPGIAEVPGESGKPGSGGDPAAGLTAQDWLVGVLPVALLIVAGWPGCAGRWAL